MSEELEGYRQFNKKDVLSGDPLAIPKPDTQLDFSKVLKAPIDPNGAPEEIKDDVEIFQKSALHGFLKYTFPQSGPNKIICNINDLLSYYNDNHKREICYEAIKFSIRMLGYVVAPQYYDQGHRSNPDDILFGVDSEVMKILKGIFQLNKDGNYIRIKYPLQD